MQMQPFASVPDRLSTRLAFPPCLFEQAEQPLIVLRLGTLRRYHPRVITAEVDLQNLAHALHAVFVLMPLDERVPHRRSSSGIE